jgi:signal transduction histidine kinase
MLQAVLEGQETERKRLARELHDGVGVMLSTIRMSVLRLAKQASQEKEALHEVRNMVDDAMENVRTVSRDLMPPTLERLGLADALEMLLERAEQSFGIPIERSLDLKEKRLAATTEIHLFRIVQELLNNALRHAQPTQIECHLTQSPASLHLTFADNGQGFEPTQEPANGLGLQNIASRIWMLKGTHTLSSKLDAGTRYEITIPISVLHP